MLDDLPSPSGESAKGQSSAISELREHIKALDKDVDPFVGPIQWIVEIEQQKRHKAFWKGIAIFSIAHLSVIYLLATIFLIRIIISI